MPILEGCTSESESLAPSEGSICSVTPLRKSALRCATIRHLKWAVVDLQGLISRIPTAEMKRGKLNGRPHFLPLAPQVVEIFEGIRCLIGEGVNVLPH